MKAQCIVCLKIFEAKRKSAMYCSNACKMRKKNHPDEDLTVITEKAVEDQWVRLGKLLLGGKKIEKIELNGKVYKLNPTQTEFICDLTSDDCLNNGGFGCIDGQTKIYDADTKEEIPIEVLYKQKKPIRVLSYSNGRILKSQATIPVRYDKAELYKVITQNREIIATKKHRFLTDNGFKKLSDLVVGEQLLGYSPCHLESNSESFQSILLSGVFHLFGKLLSFQFCYHLLSRLYDGLLREVKDNDQVFVPLQDDVPEHIHCKKQKDGHLLLAGCIHLYQRFFHHARKSFFPLEQHLVSNEEYYKALKVSERIYGLLQVVLLFLLTIILFPIMIVIALLCIFAYLLDLIIKRPLPNPAIIRETIQEIRYEKTDYYYDLHVFGTNNYLAEGLFHHNSGKTLALNIKLYLFIKCFPGNRILVGRKTLADIERAWLPDFLDLVPQGEYEHRVKDAVLNFSNGSQIILFGLDALQAGDLGDIKKAQQKIKSLNLGAFFIDQLEEIEYDVFDALKSRLRLAKVPVRQSNSTCNPANFWAYHYFVRKCVKMGDTWTERDNRSALFMSSMLDNRDNLPEDYIRRQMEGHDQKWIDRYVFGKWTPDSLTERSVFSGFSHTWHTVQPTVEDGILIWEQPKGQTYKMGVDPSEGVIDPACIAVVSGEGKLIAMFNGKVPINALAEKVKTLYYKYHKPQIVVEVNDKAGGALLENIKDLKIYRRQVFDFKDKRTSEKLGFKTNHSTKRMLISNFQNLMKQRFPKIYDQKTIEEFGTFIWADEARLQGAGAQRGFHDDRVMACLLAFWEMSAKKTEEIMINQSKPIKLKREFQYK